MTPINSYKNTKAPPNRDNKDPVNGLPQRFIEKTRKDNGESLGSLIHQLTNLMNEIDNNKTKKI